MFQIGESKDAEYVDAVKQNILDGSSKWFAKIAITGIENTYLFTIYSSRGSE